MKIFTIGFTKKSAEIFFTRLKNAGVKRLVDVRLNNVSQLAGFTKKDDLRYFTKATATSITSTCPNSRLPPKFSIPYKKAKHGDWQLYERQFLDLMRRGTSKARPRRKFWMAGACFAARKSRITVTAVLLRNT